jgi:hypothetical protein
MAKAVLIIFAPFALIAAIVFATWNLPGAALIWVTKGAAINISNGFLSNAFAAVVTLLFIALYAWPFLVIYGANQL